MDTMVPRIGGKGETMGSSQRSARSGNTWDGARPLHLFLGHTLISKHLPAVGTEEMLGVPGLLQGREDFLQEKLR